MVEFHGGRVPGKTHRAGTTSGEVCEDGDVWGSQAIQLRDSAPVEIDRAGKIGQLTHQLQP